MASQKDQPFDMQFKLLMIGDSGTPNVPRASPLLGCLTIAFPYISEVGKTCLIWRFASDQFSTKTMHTIGIDFKIKYVKIDDVRVKLQVSFPIQNLSLHAIFTSCCFYCMQIWDTAGQERFRTITTSYFRGAQGIMLVYDVTDRSSFAAVRSWMKQIELVSVVYAVEAGMTLLMNRPLFLLFVCLLSMPM